MEWIIGWIALAFVAAYIAGQKGRSALGFFALSLVLSPVIGIIAAVAAGRNEAVLDKKQLATGKARKCPYCAELVKPDALVCRYCGRSLVEPVAQIAPLMGVESVRTRGCAGCGKEIAWDAVRCRWCGVAQPPS